MNFAKIKKMASLVAGIRDIDIDDVEFSISMNIINSKTLHNTGYLGEILNGAITAENGVILLCEHKARQEGCMKDWISVKDKLPKHGEGSFLACWKNQNNLMIVCFVDIHGNYIISHSSHDTCGFGEFPKFSHWMPLPKPPEK